ncbi:GPI ethanolamine phosphate transferase 1 [Camponotus floridanus]|uniref:GPI ethanolamine phosphate transferase 1 n=1 Tax=Camponotus floridanus TaxID=104421 RepID=E2ALL2_CAMFO|nr:GPI ethanolamine phosphate transferase 1 [Camponotus floridanus]EFN65621.1 GPI ethanolamine phosphate transferase 1 [Camponotus floridanus]
MFVKKLLDIANCQLSNPERKKNKQWLETDNNYLFSLWGLIVHLILLWGVLDVNFHSPIIKELPVVPAPSGSPAKRVLLFVADGLRFQTFIDKSPPYLRDVIKNKGVWGISHTRVPTESRPGHVAIAAGLYEDPSAIFKGWQENPVDFDSVFNQSYATWAWGSPDIIPIFTKGSKRNVHGKSYPSAWQDFDSNLNNQTMRLDSWVFNAYLEWLQSSVAKMLKNQNGIILFFHLLGCDTLGHAKKPHSREYIENMNYVDMRIEEIVNMTENFFGKDTTTYVFTADHGMTDWGSHGSGLPYETETPLIVWGAGIKSGFRQDIEQASIAPLIASLIGIPIPVNNEGALPWQYFDINYQKYIGYSLLNNVKQLAYQVMGNRAINGETSIDWRETQLNSRIRKIEEHIGKGSIIDGIRESEEAISFGKEALSYFRQYQRIRFLIYLSIMWLGWIVILFLKITGTKRRCFRISILQFVNIGFASLLIIILIRYTVSNYNNWRLLCYAAFAIISVWFAIVKIITSTPVFIKRSKKKLFIDIGGTLLLLVILFVGLTYRFALSIGILSLILIRIAKSKNVSPPMIWTSIALCVFPLLPVVEPYPRVYIVIIGIFVAMSMIIINETSQNRKTMEILRIIITSLVYTKFLDGRYYISWIILLTTPLCIWSYPTENKRRMLGIMFGFFCPLTLLSASYEPLFFIILTINLFYWLQVISKRSGNTQQTITKDLIQAAFFMLYILLCFFGTGNMASISSFDPSWTRHFVTIFSPFLMTSLILFKLSIPLILVGCASYSLESEYRKPIYLAVLFLGDCLSLPLMYYVTPYGSWLDIGSAISKFIIALSLPCLFVLLRCLSYLLMELDLKRFRVNLLPQKKYIV